MKIAVASGKGGTGKTTVAVSLALAGQQPLQLLDCDVEAPNCRIFLQPTINPPQPVSVPVPVVDQEKCSRCGQCSALCQYHAIAVLETATLVFPELCHSCGGCRRICPEAAISEQEREIGQIFTGRRELVDWVEGRLNIGEAITPPLIRAVKRKARPQGTVIIDCPPGTACSLVAAVSGCDVVVLVTEPTPFGLHDLHLTVEVLRQLQLPLGVVINRSDIGDQRVEHFCARERIPIWLRIAHDRRIAAASARGEGLLAVRPELADDFRRLLENLTKLGGKEANR